MQMYETPTLLEIGTFRDLTLGNKHHGYADCRWQRKYYKPRH